MPPLLFLSFSLPKKIWNPHPTRCIPQYIQSDKSRNCRIRPALTCDHPRPPTDFDRRTAVAARCPAELRTCQEPQKQTSIRLCRTRGRSQNRPSKAPAQTSTMGTCKRWYYVRRVHTRIAEGLETTSPARVSGGGSFAAGKARLEGVLGGRQGQGPGTRAHDRNSLMHTCSYLLSRKLRVSPTSLQPLCIASKIPLPIELCLSAPNCILEPCPCHMLENYIAG